MSIHTEACFSYSLTYDKLNQVATLFGGFAPSIKFDGTWSWDGSQWLLTSTTGPAPRDSAAITYDSQGKN